MSSNYNSAAVAIWHAGKLYVLPSHNSDSLVLLLRPADGLPVLLDFGTELSEPPGGLKPNQVVKVVGTFQNGELQPQNLHDFMVVMRLPFFLQRCPDQVL